MRIDHAPKNMDSDTEERASNILNIPVNIEVLIGSARLTIDKISKLSEGSIIPLNKRVGEPAEISVNGTVLAQGNIVLLDDNSSQFGIVITDIL